MASTATYLYQDGPRYWYSTQPTVTKMAEDRAAQLLREPDKVEMEIPAPCAGVVRWSAAEGETYEVGVLLGVIEELARCGS